jgi:hypothetical protein
LVEDAMIRRSVPARITDDRRFPVGVRIAVPPAGFGNQLGVMYGWLNMHAGRGNFCDPQRAERAQGGPRHGDDAFLFRRYQRREAFVERFACGLSAVEPGRHGGAE